MQWGDWPHTVLLAAQRAGYFAPATTWQPPPSRAPLFPPGSLQFGAETPDKFETGANYALGPAVKLVGGAMYYDISGPSNAVNGKSWVFVLGMDLRF